MKERTARFLIIAGALTATGLPFALAFPKTFILKLAAVAALVAVSSAIAAGVMALRKKGSE
jgi:predicted benzoate:H+ symporter BenE